MPMIMYSTNYRETFVTASPDSTAAIAKVPQEPGTVAALQYEMIAARPYTFTSDDVIFAVYAQRNDIVEAHRAEARAAFFSKGQDWMRSSPLVKRYGWGVHHDEEGRVALYGVETHDYATFASRADLKVVPGMRLKRT